jgi:predicted ATP-grasp superfamily ATP-dependent carboligase
MKIFVTDGNSRAALAITRSLGSKGHEIVVGDTEIRSLAAGSKFCASGISYPDPVKYKQAFVDFLANVVQELGIEFLLPVADVTLLPIAENADRFESNCHLPFEDANTIFRAADKKDTLSLANSLGIPTPRTISLQGPDDNLEEIADWSFPLVIKPARSRVATDDGWESTTVSYALDISHLRKQLETYSRNAYPVLLQQRVYGPGMGIFLCSNKGEIVAAFSHRRLREKPPSGGVSVLRESVALRPDALEYAKSLLNKLNWHGVAMVEFKLDEYDDTPKLMEINGRFWGSLQLAIDAGVDFPDILQRTIVGETPEPIFNYDYGVRSRWFWGEVDLLLLYLLKTRRKLNLPATHGSRWISALRILSPFVRNQKFEVLRLSDIKPWFRESINWFKN